MSLPAGRNDQEGICLPPVMPARQEGRSSDSPKPEELPRMSAAISGQHMREPDDRHPPPVAIMRPYDIARITGDDLKVPRLMAVSSTFSDTSLVQAGVSMAAIDTSGASGDRPRGGREWRAVRDTSRVVEPATKAQVTVPTSVICAREVSALGGRTGPTCSMTALRVLVIGALLFARGSGNSGADGLDFDVSERSLRARLAVHSSWARTVDRAARTAPARRAALQRFERQVDPDGTLDPAERARRADHAMRAHMIRMTLRSVEARRVRRGRRSGR